MPLVTVFNWLRYFMFLFKMISLHFVTCLFLYGGAVLAQEDQAICNILGATTGIASWSCTGNVPTSDYCLWNGIKCDVNGTVVSLNLKRKGVDGSIPSAIGDLPSLSYLNMQQNSLVGPLSSSLENLVELEHLNLNSNELIGSIPTQLTKLKKLTMLNVHTNKLTGSVHKNFDDLDELRGLYLNGNSLTGTLPCMRQHKLEIINVSANELLTGTTCNKMCTDSTLLRKMYVDHTNIECVPQCLYDKGIIEKRGRGPLPVTCEGVLFISSLRCAFSCSHCFCLYIYVLCFVLYPIDFKQTATPINFLPLYSYSQLDELHALCRIIQTTNIASFDDMVYNKASMGWFCQFSKYDDW